MFDGKFAIKIQTKACVVVDNRSLGIVHLLIYNLAALEAVNFVCTLDET